MFSSSKIFMQDLFSRQGLFRHFQYLNGMFLFHTGEVFQELIQCFTGFNVVEQRLNRHPCSGKDRCAAHCFGVYIDCAVVHEASFVLHEVTKCRKVSPLSSNESSLPPTFRAWRRRAIELP